MQFANGEVVKSIFRSSAGWYAGGRVELDVELEGVESGYYRIGILRGASAARQFADPADVSPALASDEVWSSGELSGAQLHVNAQIPALWQDKTVVIVLELIAEQSDDAMRLCVVAGPSTELTSNGWQPGGRAVLAVIPLEDRPATVSAIASEVEMELDAEPSEVVWQQTARALVDSRSGEPEPIWSTDVSFAWNEQSLLVFANLRDEDLWSEFSAHDDPLYQQDVFELFLASDGSRNNYLELGVAPSGLSYEGAFTRHRRGSLNVDFPWQAQVLLGGTLNDSSDTDDGWSVEMAIPWSVICQHTGLVCPVRVGTRLRVNAFRLDKIGRKRPVGWALSAVREPDFHAMQRAAVLTLRSSEVTQ